MSATPESALAHPEQRIADLERQLADLQCRLAEREAELAEARKQQTATAEVLGVINSSPGDLTPVFDAMLAKAMRLCDAQFGILFTYDGELFSAVALRGVPDPYAEFLKTPLQLMDSVALGNIARGRSFVQLTDAAAGQSYPSGIASARAAVDLGGVRSAVLVALRKDDRLLGVLNVYRQEVRPFSDNQIALLQNFAAQAVIAMENARLLTETREALEQQTATAEVLQVINSSPGDLAPVFEAILDKVHRFCGAEVGAAMKQFAKTARRSSDRRSRPRRPPETMASITGSTSAWRGSASGSRGAVSGGRRRRVASACRPPTRHSAPWPRYTRK